MTVGEVIEGLQELSDADIWKIYCVGRGVSREEAIAKIISEVTGDTLIAMIVDKLGGIDY